MSADKYPCIFLRQLEADIYLYHVIDKIFRMYAFIFGFISENDEHCLFECTVILVSIAF